MSTKMVSKRKAFEKKYAVNIPESEMIECRVCNEEKEHVFIDAEMHEWGYWVERRCKDCGNQGVIIHM